MPCARQIFTENVAGAESVATAGRGFVDAWEETGVSTLKTLPLVLLVEPTTASKGLKWLAHTTK